MKILYLNTDTPKSIKLGQFLVKRLQGDEVIIESYPAIAAGCVSFSVSRVVAPSL